MKIKLPGALIAFALLFLAACNPGGGKNKYIDPGSKIQNADVAVSIHSNESSPVPTAGSERLADELQKPEDNQKQTQAGIQSTDQNNQRAKPDWDKKIIKIAKIELEVNNYKAFVSQLHDYVKESGGYIAQEEENQSAYKIENVVSIKVPIDQFDKIVEELSSGEQKVIQKKINADDVTAEVVDTKSSLESKQQIRQRFLELLKQAKNMRDILAIQNEINEVQEQIESTEGRIQYLAHSSAFSTIELSFSQILNVNAARELEPSFLGKVKLAFKDGLDFSGSLIVGIIGLWPLWISLGFLYFFYNKWKQLKTKSA